MSYYWKHIKKLEEELNHVQCDIKALEDDGEDCEEELAELYEEQARLERDIDDLRDREYMIGANK